MFFKTNSAVIGIVCSTETVSIKEQIKGDVESPGIEYSLIIRVKSPDCKLDNIKFVEIELSGSTQFQSTFGLVMLICISPVLSL